MYNSDDPRSIYYNRLYNKTPINWFRFVVILLIGLIVFVSLYFIFRSFLISLIVILIYFLCCIKYVLILTTKIYQRLAPIEIRNKCRFEPSCSNYMLICLEKYGLFKGLKKGINRLKRCNVDGGGYDFP